MARRGRASGVARSGRERMVRRRSAAMVAAALALLALAGVAVAKVTAPLTLPDARGDVKGALDMQRAALRRAADGRLRLSVTLASAIKPADLLAGTGPPGSICLKLWTVAGADPTATRPDRLVCVTARSADELRASVLEQTAPGLPKRVNSASVKLTKGGRSLILRVNQSAIGQPKSLLFAVESTRAGCIRVSCIDTVPDAPDTRAFSLR